MTNHTNSASANVSSNAFFHFTDSMENLLSILTNGFSPRYCPEYSLFDDVLTKDVKQSPSFAKAMICFCDLPLSLIKNHLNFYGSYGIGLNKSWGIVHGITPVLYIHKNSGSLKPFRELIQADKERAAKQVEPVALRETISFSLYLKPYEGPAWRNNKFISKIRFYDEREWRFAALDESIFTREQYQNDDVRNAANAKVGTRIKLNFTPDDIQYIILQNDNEIVPFVKQLKIIKNKYTEDEVTILTTSIMTAKRILEDI